MVDSFNLSQHFPDETHVLPPPSFPPASQNSKLLTVIIEVQNPLQEIETIKMSAPNQAAIPTPSANLELNNKTPLPMPKE